MMQALIDAADLVVDVVAEGFPVHADFRWVDVGTSNAAPGWTYDGSQFHPPAGLPSAADLLAQQVKAAAQAALDASDKTVLRCVEAGVLPIPPTWAAYRAALRALVTGATPVSVLPARPAYPAGT